MINETWYNFWSDKTLLLSIIWVLCKTSRVVLRTIHLYFSSSHAIYTEPQKLFRPQFLEFPYSSVQRFANTFICITYPRKDNSIVVGRALDGIGIHLVQCNVKTLLIIEITNNISKVKGAYQQWKPTLNFLLRRTYGFSTAGFLYAYKHGFNTISIFKIFII